MGILHLFDKQKNIIYIVWDGKVTAEDWLNQAQKLLAEPDFPSISRLIVDAQTASDTTSIGEKEIEAVAALFGTYQETLIKKRMAILANDLFGKASKFGNLVSRFGVSTVVFNRLDTACIFLALDSADTGQVLEQIRFQLRSGG